MKDNIISKYRFEIILFLIEAICMILELIASRVLSPYFGNSNIVWTSIIGIILLSSSIGNYLGGKIADNGNARSSLKAILISIAIFIFIIPITQHELLDMIISWTDNIKIGAIIGVIGLFFIPSMFIGLITPIILKIKLDNLDNAGKTSGRLYAISTIGGIFGTFLGGFFLIPNIGSIYILFVLTVITLLLVPIVDIKIRNKINLAIVIIIIISIILMNLFIKQNKLSGDKVLEGIIGESVSYDTQYGRVLIYNGKINDENVRILNIDSGYESATFTDEDKIYDLVFEYTKYYDLMFKAHIDIKHTMLIGGAGYSYPKYYISKYPEKNIDVIEIDGDITKIAKKYFYLDNLIEDYNLDENKRLNLIEGDGRVYINNTNKKYDAILNDAFSGSSPAKVLTTMEAVKNIKRCLNDKGVYLTNIISSLDGKDSKFIKAEVNTIKQVFKNVYVVPCNYKDDTDRVQNNMVIASDSEIDLEEEYNIDIDKAEIILTDDYCPVDTLIPEI